MARQQHVSAGSAYLLVPRASREFEAFQMIVNNDEDKPAAEVGSAGGNPDRPKGTRSGQVLWQHAKEKVMALVDVSMGFHTLRDMTGNTLDPRRMKLVCRLGSKSFRL